MSRPKVYAENAKKENQGKGLRTLRNPSDLCGKFFIEHLVFSFVRDVRVVRG
jgi:hypothetical protein